MTKRFPVGPAVLLATVLLGCGAAPSAGACDLLSRGDKVQSTVSETARSARPVSDGVRRSCLVSAARARQLKGQTVWVDVRSPVAYAHAHVQGAIHLHLSRLQASAFIPGDAKHILLVGKPSDQARLVRACAAGRNAGETRYRVLAGGVRAWLHAGGAIEGSAKALKKPQRVGVRQLRELAGTSAALYVTGRDRAGSNIGNRGDPGERGDLHFHFVHVAADKPERGAKMLRRRLAGQRLRPVVLAFAKPVDEQAWQAAMLQAGLLAPLFYTDGMAAYRQWASRHARVVAQRGSARDTGCKWN